MTATTAPTPILDWNEATAYVTWAEATIGALREELRRSTPQAAALIAEGQARAERVVREAQAQAQEVLRQACAQLGVERPGPAEGCDSAALRPSPAAPMDARVFELYRASAQALMDQLTEDVAAARSDPDTSVALARQEAERLVAAGRAEAAEAVAAVRRQLREIAAPAGGAVAPAVTAAPPPVARTTVPASAPLGRLRIPVLPPVPAALRDTTASLPALFLPAPVASPVPPIETAAPGGVEPAWARRGRRIRNAGLLLVLFVLYQLYGTNFEADRSQRKLLRNFTAALAAGTASADQPAEAEQPAVDATTTTTAPVDPGPPPPGEALAVLKIPKIGVEQVVVEGTSAADLRKGPGHYPATPRPGYPGNAGIAGHRTTYGAPFNRLDELKEGDEISVRTSEGLFRYVVAGHEVVKPKQVEVLLPKGDNRLTLTTCHPKYRAIQRYVVWATLHPDDKPIGTAAPPGPQSPAAPELAAGEGEEQRAAAPPPATIATEEGGGGLQLSAFPGAVFWSAVLAGGLRLTRDLRRSRHRYAVSAAVALPFAFFLLQSFRSVSQLLPPNF